MAKVSPAGSWIQSNVLLLTAIVACGASGNVLAADSDDANEHESVNVVLKEWYILPDKMTVDGRYITFKVANQGRRDHEFIIIKTDVPVHDLPVHAKGLDEKKVGKAIGEIEDIHPGETKDLTLHMSVGNYVLFCNKVEIVDHKIISHYRHGMRVAFKVK